METRVRRSLGRGVLAVAPRRMLWLQPLIDRFVDDVLRAIRNATLEDLRNLTSARAESAPAARPAARKAKPRNRAGSRSATLPSRRQPAPTHVGTGVLEQAPVLPQEPRRPAPDPSGFAEITDPERLLAAQPPHPPETAAPPRPQAAAAGQPPPRAERPAHRPAVPLREGETLVRADAGAVVIRRAKRG